MQSLCGVYLNGRSLSWLHPGLAVTDVVLEAASRKVQTARPAGSLGFVTLSEAWEPARVRVRFAVNEADAAARSRALLSLFGMAAMGGWLTTDARPGWRLFARLEALPALSSLHWSGPLELVFVSEGVPFWQEAQSRALSLTGTACEGTLYAPPGPVPVPLRVRIQAEAALSRLHITAGKTRFDLRGLGLAAGETLTIGHTPDGILRIAEESTGHSLLSCRTPESDDALLLMPGKQNAVVLNADAPVQAQIEARGWMP